MPERMRDVLQAASEAATAGDGDRLRRLFTPDAVIDPGRPGGRRLTVDELVAIHVPRSPLLGWHIQRFEALDGATAVVSGTMAVRVRGGVTWRRFVHLCRFRGGRLARVDTHPSREAARAAYADGAAAPGDPPHTG